MTLPEPVIAATEARFAARAPQRADIEKRLRAARRAEGSILGVDDPERVALRARRVLNQPIMAAAIGPAGVPAAPDSSEDGSRLLERIINGDNLLGISFLELGTSVSQSVCRIAVRDRVQTLGFGTGFLVSPRLLLTNNHVLPNEESARFSLAEFNFQNGVDGLPLPVSRFTLEPGTLFLTDVDLDFTITAVASFSQPDGGEAPVPLSAFGFNRTTKEQGKILLGEAINIVQHPDGQPKQIALQQNELIDRLDNFLHYHTDTAPGSSGSPLYNNQWEILGLHHSGVPARNDAGDILAVDGAVWTADQGEAKIHWIANEGVRISSIHEHLTAAAATLGAEQQSLVNDLLHPDGASATTAPAVPSPAPPALPDAERAEQRPADAAQATATVLIPLQVTVMIGQPRSAGPAPATALDVPPVAAGAPVATVEAVTIDPDYQHREGYDPQFLSTAVPLPVLTDQQLGRAARNSLAAPGQDPTVLNYHHFSLVMDSSRKLAFYTVVNVDGSLNRLPKRESDAWFFDPRIPKSTQIGGDFYEGNDFDRGHLVRRLDPAWGTVDFAKIANDDTFHFTNCSPQHKDFNQGKSLWAGLENYLLGNAEVEKMRITIFTGPVCNADDPVFNSVQIPLAFWKIAVFRKQGGTPSATGFIVSQRKLVEGVLTEAFVPETFQVPVRKIGEQTGLNFDYLFGWDPLDTAVTESAEAREALRIPTPGTVLRSFDDVRF